MAPSSRLVFIGAGHASLFTLARLDDFTGQGVSVTVISPSPFWYSGMGPGLLSQQYQAAETTVDVRAIVEANGGLFVEEYAVAIDASERMVTTEAGRKVPYDVLCINIGSEVSCPAANIDSDWQFRVKLYLSNTDETTPGTALSPCITDIYVPRLRPRILSSPWATMLLESASVVLRSIGGGGMAENLNVVNTAVSLLIRATVLAARFSGRVRRRSLKRLAIC